MEEKEWKSCLWQWKASRKWLHLSWVLHDNEEVFARWMGQQGQSSQPVEDTDTHQSTGWEQTLRAAWKDAWRATCMFEKLHFGYHGCTGYSRDLHVTGYPYPNSGHLHLENNPWPSWIKEDSITHYPLPCSFLQAKVTWNTHAVSSYLLPAFCPADWRLPEGQTCVRDLYRLILCTCKIFNKCF